MSPVLSRVRAFFAPVLTTSAETERNEREQARLRIILPAIGVLWVSLWHLLHAGGLSPPVQWFVLGLVLHGLLGGVGLLAWIRHQWPGARWRVLLWTVHDRAVIATCLALFGLLGAISYPFYLWVDIGNGMRYGRHTLAVSMVLSLGSFLAVIAINAEWRTYWYLSVPLWIGLLVVPCYTFKLLRRIETFAETLSVANAELTRLATHDTVTELPNRVHVYRRMAEAIADGERFGRCFAVLFVNLDNFKAMNDRHGHEAGDRALKATARILRDSLRKSDTVARLGGDEFLALLYNTDPQHIFQVADTVREALRQYSDNPVITASIGVALYPDSGRDPETLVRHADEAMYEAKRAGKNCCVLHATCHHPRRGSATGFSYGPDN
jgi:diguanylate cyclase (GGDEF)-like protein